MHRWRSVTAQIRRMQPRSVWQSDADEGREHDHAVDHPASLARHKLCVPHAGGIPSSRIRTVAPSVQRRAGAERVERSHVLEGGTGKAEEIMARYRSWLTYRSTGARKRGWHRGKHFAARWAGGILIWRGGLHHFQPISDDGSKLWVSCFGVGNTPILQCEVRHLCVIASQVCRAQETRQQRSSTQGKVEDMELWVMPLGVASGSSLPTPVQRDGVDATFQALAEQFQLNEETMTYIKGREVETLNDLRFSLRVRAKWQPSSLRRTAFQTQS
jgi:hypothetical protein